MQGEDIYPLPVHSKGMAKMSKLWDTCTYDLPADFSLYMAAVIVVVFVFTPTSPSFPLSQIVAVGVIVYFSWLTPGPIKLGLSFNISRQGWRAIILISAVTLLVLLLTLLLMSMAKGEYYEGATQNEDIWRQETFEFIGSWAPDTLIHKSLYEKDLGSVIRYTAKPFLGMVIMASTFETIIIFGILFPTIWRRNGYRKALLAVPLVFALLHIFRTSIPGFVIIYLNGVVQALLYAKTKSLYPAITLHVCWNLNILLFFCFMNWGLPYE